MPSLGLRSPAFSATPCSRNLGLGKAGRVTGLGVTVVAPAVLNFLPAGATEFTGAVVVCCCVACAACADCTACAACADCPAIGLEGAIGYPSAF